MTLVRKAASLACAAVLTTSAALAADAPPFVAGYELLPPQSAEAGEVLLSELSCLACHRDESKLPPALAWKPGPLLGDVGDRLRAEYIQEFLTNPAATKPGTTMPHVLAGQPAETVENLTHFLLQMRGTKAAGAPAAGDAAKGRGHFENIGCIACHAKVPLVRLAEKYAPGQLARFLQHPLETRPGARMPDFHLDAEQAADLAAFLAPEPPATKARFSADPAKAALGAQAFQTLGCISCHGGGGNAKPLAVLNAQTGCLAEASKPGVPHYTLSQNQRAAIRAALLARQQTPADEKLLARRLMLQRNCFACHARENLGGPAPGIAAHFTSTRDDLGEQGSKPPPLDGAGRKLHEPALARILRGQDPVRTYMQVKMPDFGPELSEHLSPLLARIDADPNEEPATAKANPNQVGRNEAGREIVGTKGYACITCHSLHGHPSLGIGAYDMAEMPKRLRPEWMRDFLLNPGAFPTGTRMPAFWPGGKPSNPKLGGNADRQIDSIRVYLSEVDQSLPPEGFHDPAASELKPKDRPIIFRTFMESAGMQAVAVGFPQGVSVAFDAWQVRWALAWRGRFLDADGTWHQRVAKIEKPLGEHRVSLENAGTLVVSGAHETKPKYRGYRVAADGTPTFLYDLGALRIEDRIAPATGPGLRRTLRVTGQTTERVEFRAAPPAGLSVQVAGQAQFPIPLKFTKGAAEIVEDISW